MNALEGALPCDGLVFGVRMEGAKACAFFEHWLAA